MQDISNEIKKMTGKSKNKGSIDFVQISPHVTNVNHSGNVVPDLEMFTSNKKECLFFTFILGLNVSSF